MSLTPNTILHGDALGVLKTLDSECVDCVVTSPPYWGLRDYGVKGQLGLEKTFPEYLEKMVLIFEEVRRVLKKDGTLWLNMGDSYSNDTKWGGKSGGKNYTSEQGGYQGQRVRRGTDVCPKRGVSGEGQPKKFCTGLKPKDLMGQPWRMAFALQAAGWYLRSDIIWHKPNPMPESVTDRPTKAHEYIFLLAKSQKYYYDAEAINVPVSENTHARISQNLEAQIGSQRAHAGGKTNGAMKAVVGPKALAAIKNGSDQGRSEATERFGRGAGWRVKHNASFNSACVLRVATRNSRTVWTVATQGYKGAHFATFPEALIDPCIRAGCPAGGLVYDPFMGSGTTALVAAKLGRRWAGSELNEKYIALAMKRLGLFAHMGA